MYQVCQQLIRRVTAIIVIVVATMAQATFAWATPPTLYNQAAYQSPLRGEPDDLLLLPGYGFAVSDVVVYQAIADTTLPLNPPTSVPGTSTATLGVAPVVSTTNVPDSLTVKLPAVMQSGRSYAMWVHNSNGEWSNPIKINDARPLWISPDYVYASASLASLPRYVKVVGRNLQPASGAVTQVRLVGPSTFTLAASNDGDPSTAIEHYVAKISLPSGMPTGTYTVQVSRDGTSWVALSDQSLTVKADPVTPTQFPISNPTYGGCAPNDGLDDTACIINAINAAKTVGGTVVFGPGVWNLTNSATPGVLYGDGIVVPIGVSLSGAGADVTTLVRDENWNVGAGNATFTLLGSNTVQAIKFKDNRNYQPSDWSGTMLQLGKIYYQVNNPYDPKLTSDIVITQNVFDKPFVAIGNGGLPMGHVFITYNEFGAYNTALAMGGDGNNLYYKFRIDDSVVTNNTFKPGSYLDVANVQGTIATQLGASRRVDFSNNIADGTSTQYLWDPVNDAKGWRAGFFWAMNNNSEMLLVSQNNESCTGDKDGDGEAIAYDNNHNSFAFSQAQTVVSASANTVTVQGPLVTSQDGHSLLDTNSITGQPYLNDYYLEHWVQIAQGPGVGQVRRIVSYVFDSSGSPVTFTVSPAWDVIPQTTSRMTVAREFWQTHTVDNIVDHRTPLCLKSNRTAQRGGRIGLWAQMADSAVEGNRQYDTDGITLQQSYSAVDPAYCASCTSSTFFQTFVEVRGNTIDHEYNWNSDCSWSGLWGSYSASPTTDSPPPVAGYGVSFARNTIIQADGLRGGAITLSRSWFAGPPPYNWKLVNNTLIYHNVIQDLVGPVPQQQCDDTQSSRIGIQLYDPLVWQTVVYANSCNNVSTLLHDGGTGTARVCPSGVLNSCECVEADLAVTVTPSVASLNIGENITYTIQVTNNGLAAASNVTLVDNLPAGLNWISTSTTQGACTNGQNITCSIGGIIKGGAVTVTIVAKATAAGVQTNSATLSANETDPNPANNTASVGITVAAPDLVPTAISASKSSSRVYVSDTVNNQGNGNAGSFTVSYYLSTNATFEAGTDLPLASTSGGSTPCTRIVTSLTPGATSSVSNKVCYRPGTAKSRVNYYVLVVDDLTNQVIESNEANNVRATTATLRW